MPFKITIVEIKEVQCVAGREWKIVADLDDGKHEYGYTPEFTTARKVEIDRLCQVVDEIDMVAVIKAINGLPA